VAHSANGRSSAIDGRTTRHVGYAVSHRIRRRIEEAFGWIKTVAGQERTKFRGRERVWLAFALARPLPRSIPNPNRRSRRLCATIVIAHRLSTVADEICVLDRGRVVERGRHGELLALGGDYSSIARTQFPRDAA
jgi:hypothetical protein